MKFIIIKRLFVFIILLAALVLLIVNDAKSSGIYRVYVNTLNDDPYYGGDTIQVDVQVTDLNDVSLPGKEVYLFFDHVNTGYWIVYGNIGTTDFTGHVYEDVPVDLWFAPPYCGSYRVFAKVWENGEFVAEGWSSRYIYPTGCSPGGGGSGPVAGIGGSPFVKKKVSEALV